jgi:archaellum component FlaC
LGLKDLAKKCASPFFEFKEPEQVTGEQPATPPTTVLQVATPALRVFKPTSVQPEIDQDLRGQIVADVEKATPPSLVEFFGLLDSMKELGMDDATRFKAAFTAFQKTSKGTIDTLLNGIQKQLDALEATGVSIENELKGDSKKIALKRKQAEDAQAQIDNFRQQIAELDATRSQLQVEASQDEQALGKQQLIITNTVDDIRAEINERESQIQQYLGSTVSATSTKTRKRT